MDGCQRLCCLGDDGDDVDYRRSGGGTAVDSAVLVFYAGGRQVGWVVLVLASFDARHMSSRLMMS